MANPKLCSKLLSLNKKQICCNLSKSASLVRSFASESDPVTHTGQKFDEKDYRLVRFIGKHGKDVNPNWAIELIDQVPPTVTKDRIVACDGGGGPLGHPKVYINLDRPGNGTCGYCGLRFKKEDDHHH